MKTKRRHMMKTAAVFKDWTGYWVVITDDTNEQIGGHYRSELEAYKAANRAGYIVV